MIDYKLAKRLTSIYTQKLNGPMREIEALQNVIAGGGFTDDVSWKMLPPEAKERVIKALENRRDAQIAKLEAVIDKLQAALTEEP
jgi:hypothetical protein